MSQSAIYISVPIHHPGPLQLINNANSDKIPLKTPVEESPSLYVKYGHYELP